MHECIHECVRKSTPQTFTRQEANSKGDKDTQLDQIADQTDQMYRVSLLVMLSGAICVSNTATRPRACDVGDRDLSQSPEKM